MPAYTWNTRDAGQCFSQSSLAALLFGAEEKVTRTSLDLHSFCSMQCNLHYLCMCCVVVSKVFCFENMRYNFGEPLVLHFSVSVHIPLYFEFDSVFKLYSNFLKFFVFPDNFRSTVTVLLLLKYVSLHMCTHCMKHTLREPLRHQAGQLVISVPKLCGTIVITFQRTALANSTASMHFWGLLALPFCVHSCFYPVTDDFIIMSD